MSIHLASDGFENFGRRTTVMETAWIYRNYYILLRGSNFPAPSFFLQGLALSFLSTQTGVYRTLQWISPATIVTRMSNPSEHRFDSLEHSNDSFFLFFVCCLQQHKVSPFSNLPDGMVGPTWSRAAKQCLETGSHRYEVFSRRARSSTRGSPTLRFNGGDWSVAPSFVSPTTQKNTSRTRHGRLCTSLPALHVRSRGSAFGRCREI
jgi:hypothetical protein